MIPQRTVVSVWKLSWWRFLASSGMGKSADIGSVAARQGIVVPLVRECHWGQIQSIARECCTKNACRKRTIHFVQQLCRECVAYSVLSWWTGNITSHIFIHNKESKKNHTHGKHHKRFKYLEMFQLAFSACGHIATSLHRYQLKLFFCSVRVVSCVGCFVDLFFSGLWSYFHKETCAHQDWIDLLSMFQILTLLHSQLTGCFYQKVDFGLKRPDHSRSSVVPFEDQWHDPVAHLIQCWMTQQWAANDLLQACSAVP